METCDRGFAEFRPTLTNHNKQLFLNIFLLLDIFAVQKPDENGTKIERL